eukprot:2515142-Alexandrium_andersonii.AAC.1
MVDWAHLSRRHPAEDTDSVAPRRAWTLPLAPPMTWAESRAALAAHGRGLQRLRPPPPRTRPEPPLASPLPPPPPPYLPGDAP